MRNGKIDATHRAIRDDLRKLGWKVLDTHNLPGFVDMVAYHPPTNRIVMIEAKADGKSRLTESQRKLMGEGWPIVTATCAEDVYKS